MRIPEVGDLIFFRDYIEEYKDFVNLIVTCAWTSEGSSKHIVFEGTKNIGKRFYIYHSEDNLKLLESMRITKETKPEFFI